MFEGVWLGINGGAEEVLIGTRKGVVKCRTVKRLPESQRWDPALVHEMKGTTWCPVPGYKSDHVPVEIDDKGLKNSRDEEDDDEVKYEVIPIEEDVNHKVKVKRSKVTDIRVSHNDVAKHGATPGCPACEYILQNKKIATGVAHSKECRQRIREAMEAEDDVGERVRRANKRQGLKAVHQVQPKIDKSVPKYK